MNTPPHDVNFTLQKPI